jgi:hypothetical protein
MSLEDLMGDDEDGGAKPKRRKGRGAKGGAHQHRAGLTWEEVDRQIMEGILNGAAVDHKKMGEIAGGQDIGGPVQNAMEKVADKFAERTARATESASKTLERILSAMERQAKGGGNGGPALLGP